MLILTRRIGETLMIGDQVTVTVLAVVSRAAMRPLRRRCQRPRPVIVMRLRPPVVKSEHLPSAH